MFKVEGEVAEKVGNARVIAIAKNNLALEVLAIMLCFIFDVNKGGEKTIRLCDFRVL